MLLFTAQCRAGPCVPPLPRLAMTTGGKEKLSAQYHSNFPLSPSSTEGGGSKPPPYGRSYIKTVIFPSLDICIYVIPYPQIIAFISYDMVMEWCLKHPELRGNSPTVSCSYWFEYTYYFTNGFFGLLDRQQKMDMVWHYYIFVNNDTGETELNFFDLLLCNLPEYTQGSKGFALRVSWNRRKNFLLLKCADRYKIRPVLTVIIIFQAWVLSFR